MRLKPCLIICSLVVSLAEFAQAFTIIDWDKQQTFCGHRFADVLTKYCLVHNSPDHNAGSYHGTPKTPKQECCDKYCSVRYILINYCTRVKENFMEKYNETWERPKSDLLNEIVRESDRKRPENHPAARSVINTMAPKMHQDAKLGIEQAHQMPINLDFNIKDFINQ